MSGEDKVQFRAILCSKAVPRLLMIFQLRKAQTPRVHQCLNLGHITRRRSYLSDWLFHCLGFEPGGVCILPSIHRDRPLLGPYLELGCLSIRKTSTALDRYPGPALSIETPGPQAWQTSPRLIWLPTMLPGFATASSVPVQGITFIQIGPNAYHDLAA